MTFSHEKVEAVRERCDIVQVIGNYVQLKKSGRNYVGLCPFHDEKSPSFSVSAEKKVYHCFGCSAGGDVFNFLMRHEGMDFQQAARHLAMATGVEVTPESPAAAQQRQVESQLAAVNACALQYFTERLWQPEGIPARRYLQSRQIPAAFAQERQLGYGHQSDSLLMHLQSHGHPVEAARAAGILPEEGNRMLFAGRVIFPIRDLAGRVAGFGGRRLDDTNGGPKYINSRDSVLFKKSALLYGLFEAQGELRRSKRIVIMEGYTDVLAAQRSGVEGAVAALGTAFSAAHAKAAKRLAHEAVVLLDPDMAGQAAAHRVSMLLLQAGLSTRVATLPTGLDPDALVQKRGAAALVQTIAAARAAVEYFMEVAFANDDLGIEERAKAARQLQPLLMCVDSGLARDLYMNRLADKVGVTLEQLRSHLQSSGADARAARRFAVPEARHPPASMRHTTSAPAAISAPAATSAPDAPLPFELTFLRELLLYPQLRAQFGELAEYAVSQQMRELLEELAQTAEPLEKILDRRISDDGWYHRLTHIKAVAIDPLDGENVKSNQTFNDILASFKRRHLDTALREILYEVRDAESRGEATDKLLRRKQELTARKRALKKSGQAAGVNKER